MINLFSDGNYWHLLENKFISQLIFFRSHLLVMGNKFISQLICFLVASLDNGEYIHIAVNLVSGCIPLQWRINSHRDQSVFRWHLLVMENIFVSRLSVFRWHLLVMENRFISPLICFQVASLGNGEDKILDAISQCEQSYIDHGGKEGEAPWHLYFRYFGSQRINLVP